MENELSKLIGRNIKVVYEDDLKQTQIKSGRLRGVDEIFFSLETSGRTFDVVLLPIKAILRVELMKGEG